MTTPVDSAFEACGQIAEQSNTLCDAAADLEDEQLSRAAERVRHWTSVSGQRLVELRRIEKGRAA